MTTAYPDAELTRQILKCAFDVHSRMGPGLLESVYRACLLHELRRNGIEAKAEVPIPVEYRGTTLDVGFRCDVLVEARVLLELKCVQQVLPIHEAQLITYLRLSRVNVGLLLNFNVVSLKNGIRRLIWQAGKTRRHPLTP